MKKTTILRAMTLVTAIANVGISAAFAQDASVCYEWSNFKRERTVINVNSNPTPISLNQFAYSVHGKEIGICGGNSMATSAGTVVVSTSSSTHDGARMGLDIIVARAGDTCRNVILDCRSHEKNPTPHRWSCEARNDFGIFLGKVELERTNGHRCDLFQESLSMGAYSAESNEGSEPGPGQNVKFNLQQEEVTSQSDDTKSDL